ncbi:hypothetical protein K7W03_25555 [Sphingobium sp. PNB]|uniref:hypothetical protein n=1 Tax=Sphingobium sp. PNB TaxID=863934 RepID=UPI001CA45BF7|nr:hypothetical protein [Sphingobium sp. PNB]MCB4862953.1 hypothetical protein [Sphingobium sp. PNB]
MSKANLGHDLSGLIRFAERAPWDERLVDMLALHLDPVCEASGLDPEAIFDAVGHHWEGTLWGCAFEDLMAREPEADGPNLVDDYLKRRGWNERAPNKAYMRALNQTAMSLYEVSEVVPGQSMRLRDLLRESEPVTVLERGATRTLVNWDRIATRVVQVNGRYGISGALLPFGPDASAELISTIARLEADSAPDHDTLLRSCAPLFTGIWMLDALGVQARAEMPELVNADGEDVVFHRVVFPLAKGANRQTVARMLDAANWLEPASDSFWNWLAPRVGKKKPGKAKGKQALATTMQDGTPVFANVELKGRQVVVEVNSSERAETAKALMAGWLGERIGPPLTEIRTLAQMLADDAADEEHDDGLQLPPEETERVVHEMLTREYTKALDQPVPMLGDRTPRALARTKAGRVKVAEWLRYLENGSAKSRAADDPMATFDFTWMWEQLGVADLRK